MKPIFHRNRKKLDNLAANLITDTINRSNKHTFILAFPGGRSVNGIFQALLEQEIKWRKVHIFLTDERIVPLSSKDSNYSQLKEQLLIKLENNSKPLPTIHFFDTENESLENSLENYSQEIKELGGKFDIVLLSAGEDGHVASLFPEHASVRSRAENYLLVENSPKPPEQRISISRNLLIRSQSAILLFYGNSKAKALRKFLNTEITPESCPAKFVDQIEHSFLITDQNITSG